LLFQAANYYSITGRANTQAISWLMEAEKLDPENFYYPTLRQKLSVELKDYSGAVEAAKKALAIAEQKKMKSVEKLKNQVAELELLAKNN
jgi:tetratricopeptide (TPR) repeat protein